MSKLFFFFLLRFRSHRHSAYLYGRCAVSQPRRAASARFLSRKSWRFGEPCEVFNCRFGRVPKKSFHYLKGVFFTFVQQKTRFFQNFFDKDFIGIVSLKKYAIWIAAFMDICPKQKALSAA